MIHLDTELGQLKQAVIDMMILVEHQLEKSKEAYINMDSDLAEEIIHTEKRVNAMEISIDRDCEKLFALLTPVATDLRFVISVLKINSDLERIGDYAENIAKYVIAVEKEFTKEQIERVRLLEMFSIANEMLYSIREAFESDDTKLARKVFKKDKKLNKINENASKIIAAIVKDKPSEIRAFLFLFSTIRKLERVGDHIKNISENIIFYLEAKVLKHKKKLK